MKATKLPEHNDAINQPIQIGQYVAFTFAYSIGIKVGQVIKLTKQRVKIGYKHVYTDVNNNIHTYNGTYLARPERIIALTDTLPQELTMLKLKNLIP